MKWHCLIYLLLVSYSILGQGNNKTALVDYSYYHELINKAEGFVGSENYQKALDTYKEVSKVFDFVFLRDYKVAAQLAFYLDDKETAFNFINDGIVSGWDLKELKKEKFLSPLQKEHGWALLKRNYDSLHQVYLNRINPVLRDRVHEMFKRDQKKAMGALFKIGNSAQEQYGTEKFAPHSEQQMAQLFEIMDNHGYPGERIIGNDYWMSTVISHHNSISEEYTKKDTLYNYIRPALKRALALGQISPYEFSMIDDWRIAVVSNRTAVGYGFLNAPLSGTLSETNALRGKAGLRTIKLRNRLVDLENKTGMNFYLPDWVIGKIEVEEN
ncbi:hypothetical protein [Eudoraea sp.]|uniref:hypothetical protein n=1 Tax=Eudoraea sp. TaxID=1979955 RepID=UPI003C721594